MGGNDLGVLKIRYHYDMHGWSLDDPEAIRCYRLTVWRLLLGIVILIMPGDYAGRAMVSGASHLLYSSCLLSFHLRVSNERLRWLQEQLGGGPPSDATNDVVQQYARAYILALIASVLLPDKSGVDVRLFVLRLL